MASIDELYDTREPISIAPPPPITPPDISIPDVGVDSLYDTGETDLFGKDRVRRNLNISKTLKLNPNKEADLLRKARDTGQSTAFLRASEDVITTSPDIPSNLPPGVLTHLSKSPSHAAISGNDIPGLSSVEKLAKQAGEINDSELSWWGRFTHNLEAGTKDVIKNTTGSIRAFADFFGEMDKRALAALPEESRDAELTRRSKLSPIAQAFMIDQEELATISAKAREIQESEFLEVVELRKRPGVAGYFDDVVRMGPQILFLVVAATTTGNIGSVAFMASQIGGGKFTQLEAQGVDTVTAFQASLADAALQAPLEAIGIRSALGVWKPGKALGKVFKDVIGAMGTEFITEWLQKYPEAATEIWAKAQENDVPVSEQVDLFFKDFADITIAGMYEGLVAAPFGGLISAVNIGAQVHKDSSWVDRQQTINDAVNETQTKTTSPEVTKDFLDIVGLGDDMFMSPEGIKVLFQTDPEGEIFTKLGVDPQEARQASDAGIDISFPESSMHSALSPEEFTQIKDHIKAAPGASTAFDRESGVAIEAINRLDAIGREVVENQKAFNVESERIKEQVISTGHTQEFADTYIDTVERFANRIALEGRDRVDFLKGINIKVKSRAESETGRVLEDEPIIDPLELSEFDQKGLVFEQAEKKVPPRGSIKIDSEGYLVSLFQTRNMSTLIHETGHIFFEEMTGLVGTGQASEQLTKDVETIRQWLELEPGQEFTDEHHEKFARGFEAYLLEGKAPTVELSTAFARFKRWLSQVYQNVKELNVTLNADIRKVFDRMLIAEAEVENAADLNGLVLDQEKMDALGVVAEDQAFMKRLIKTAEDKGKDGLTKDRNRGYRDNIKKWRAEATEEIDSRKEYQDVADIVDTGGMNREEYVFDYGEVEFEIERLDDRVPVGELQVGDTFEIDGEKHTVIGEDENGDIIIRDGFELTYDVFDGVPVDGGISGVNREAVDAHKLPNRRLLKSKARSIGSVALGHGYDSANQMIEMFHNMLPRPMAIKQLVNEKQAEFDAQFKAEDYLMGTKEFAEYLTILSKYLEGSPIIEAGVEVPAGKKSTKTISRQRFKAFAVETIDAMSVRDARRTDRFMAAFRKADNQMRNALLSGDIGKAAKANERARLNYELAGESIRIRKETDKLLRRSGRVITAKLDNDYKQQVLKLLRRFALTDRKFRIDEDAPPTEVFFLKLHTKSLEDADLWGGVPIFDPFLMEDKTSDYRDLSVIEIRQVEEMMGYLVKKGRDILNKTLSDGKTLIDDKALELSDWILTHRKKDKKSIEETKKRLRKASDFTREFFAHSDELIFIMRRLDGFVSVKGEIGPNESFWNDQLKIAEEGDQIRIKNFSDEMKPLMEQFGKSARKLPNKIDIKGVPVPENMRKHGRVWNYHKILAVGLNMGNQVNRERVQTGYGNLTEHQLNQITSVLTKQDWQAIQKTWDVIDKMWPELSRVHFALNGFHRPKVKADPFTVTALNEETGNRETITLKGGYYHIEYDPELADQVEEWTEKDDLVNSTDSFFPATSAKSGNMITRVKTTHLPVKLSLSVLYKQISESSRYISYGELLSDLSQVLKHPSYKETIDVKEGVHVRKQLRPILSNIARPHDNMMEFTDRWLDREIGRSTVNILGSSLTVPVKQMFSLPLFINEVGNNNTAKGLAIYINGLLGRNGVLWNPFEARRAMHEMEPFMAQRSKSFDRELQIVFKKVDLDPKLFGKFTANDLGAVFMSAIRAVDFMTVYPAWWSAYQDGLIKNGGDSNEARKHATRLIRFTQPAALPVDKNWFQRSKKGWHRMASMFSSFTFKHGQHQRFNWNAWNERDANGKRVLSSAKYFNNIITTLMAPPLAMSLLIATLRGEDYDPEELLIDVASYQFMGVFLVRDITGFLGFALKKGGGFKRDPFSSPAFQGGQLVTQLFYNMAELIGDLGDEDKQLEALMSFASLIGYGYRAPVDRVAKQIIKGWEQFDREGGTPTKILFPSHKR